MNTELLSEHRGLEKVNADVEERLFHGYMGLWEWKGAVTSEKGSPFEHVGIIHSRKITFLTFMQISLCKCVALFYKTCHARGG